MAAEKPSRKAKVIDVPIDITEEELEDMFIDDQHNYLAKLYMNVVKDYFLEEFTNVSVEYVKHGRKSMNVFYSRHTNTELFRISCKTGDIYVKIMVNQKVMGQYIYKYRDPIPLKRLQEAKVRLKSQTVCLLHEMLGDTLNRYQNGMKLIATNRGADLEPDAMMMELMLESEVAKK